MYPTKEEFEEMLRTRNLDCILDEHLFAGLPFSFADQPEVHRQMIGEISRGFRRPSADVPFKDLIHSSTARGLERELAPHPSLKPQAFIRQIVRASLPLGEGIVLDPFMGSGSTIAAASRLGIYSIGIEYDEEYFRMAESAVPLLAALDVAAYQATDPNDPGSP